MNQFKDLNTLMSSLEEQWVGCFFFVSPPSGRWGIDCERTTHVKRKI
jgi:hypothetical protein